MSEHRPTQQRKPRDVGNGTLAASWSGDAVLAVATSHPTHGLVEFTNARPFPETSRGNEAEVRAYRAHLADAVSACVRVDNTVPVRFEPIEGEGAALQWRLVADLPGPATLRVAGRVQRPAYAEITEIAPLTPLSDDTHWAADGATVTASSATLGSEAVVRVLAQGATTWRPDADGAHVMTVQVGPDADVRIGIDLTVEGRILSAPRPTHVVPLATDDLDASVLASAVAFALGCCALDVSPDHTCVVTEHRLLPLSWTRDAYFTVLPLLLTGEPASEAEDVVARHLAWLFGPARAEGAWMRAHLTGGQVKDPGLQADQQLYPVLELVDFRTRFGRWPSGDPAFWADGVRAALADLETADNGLLVSDENPADDPVEYPHNFSTQVLYVETLCRLAGVAAELDLDAARLAADADAICARSREVFLASDDAGAYYAYEADGLGGQRFYADANDVPTAMAARWGFVDADDPAWRGTVLRAFDPSGAFTIEGRLGGLGSLHTAGVWALGVVQELIVAMTLGDTERQERVRSILGEVLSSDGMLPETFDAESGRWLSRHWFAWPGALLASVLTEPTLRPSPASPRQ